jgi:hypothetical protein
MPVNYPNKARGRFRTIYMRMWGDEKFRRLSPMPACGQGLWVYLLTGPHTGPIPGIFESGRAAMAESLGWSFEDFDKAFREVLSQGLCEVDWDARIVWVPKAVEYNKPQSPNVVLSWLAEWEKLPECDLKWRACEALRAFICRLGEGYREAFAQAFGETRRKTSRKTTGKSRARGEQEQEQEQEESQKHMSTSSHATKLDHANEHDTIAKIFAYWRERMHSPRSSLSDRRRRLISTALKVHSPADLCSAIRGCSKDAWHMGMNDRGRPFNSIELILRDEKHIEQFMAYDANPPLPVRNAGPASRQDRRRKTAEAFGFVPPLTDESIVDLPPEDAHAVDVKH